MSQHLESLEGITMAELAHTLFRGLIFFSLFIATPALAIPVTVTSSDVALCDPLVVPTNVDELGDPAAFPPFPPDERAGVLPLRRLLDGCAYPPV